MEIETWLSVFSGGLSGAYLSFRFNSSRYRTELSLKLIEKIGEKVEEIENAYSILQSDVSQDGEIWDKDETLRKKKFDTIIRVGDYLDTISFLYLSYNLDRKFLIKSKICLILDEFISMLKEFKTSRYNAEKNRYEHQNWVEAWPYLQEYKDRKVYKWDLFKRILFG